MSGTLVSLEPSTDLDTTAGSTESTPTQATGLRALLRRLYDKAYLYPCF